MNNVISKKFSITEPNKVVAFKLARTNFGFGNVSKMSGVASNTFKLMFPAKGSSIVFVEQMPGDGLVAFGHFPGTLG